MTQFSVVVPTLDEADNIDPLLTRLFALDLAPGSFEVIFVDDGSHDGTPGRVRAWEGRAPVRLVERREKPDLTGSISGRRSTGAGRGHRRHGCGPEPSA